MYQVAFANSFKKAYKKCVKRGLPVEDLQATITIACSKRIASSGI